MFIACLRAKSALLHHRCSPRSMSSSFSKSHFTIFQASLVRSIKGPHKFLNSRQARDSIGISNQSSLRLHPLPGPALPPMEVISKILLFVSFGRTDGNSRSSIRSCSTSCFQERHDALDVQAIGSLVAEPGHVLDREIDFVIVLSQSLSARRNTVSLPPGSHPRSLSSYSNSTETAMQVLSQTDTSLFLGKWLVRLP